MSVGSRMHDDGVLATYGVADVKMFRVCPDRWSGEP